jgi:mannose-6-phosphate isomerase-like protein (cupin superfamily)
MSHDPKPFRAAEAEGRWEAVDVLTYKAEGAAPFKDVTRQVLFDTAELGCELRYFEVAPGGHSTLERHEHVHAVVILRGEGRCMVGGHVRDVRERDLVAIPPMTWHQFRASATRPLGFLCMVNRERDRPQLPSEAERAALREHPDVARFLDDG